MKKYYTRKEAAEMLGCNPQTITNYSERGLFATFRGEKVTYVEKKSFDKFLANGYLKICEKQDAIDAYLKELDEKKDEIETEIKRQDERRKELMITNSMFAMFNREELFSQIVKGVLCACNEYDDLSIREYSILVDYMLGIPQSKTADRLGLTVERVRTILRNSFRGVSSILLKCREHKKEIETLTVRCKKQNDYIKQLRSSLISITKKCDEKTSLKPLEEKYTRTRDLPLFEFDFSCRTYNALKSIGVETVYQLLHVKKQDLLSIRNFGRKSMEELECLLEQLGFCVGELADNPDYPLNL